MSFDLIGYKRIIFLVFVVFLHKTSYSYQDISNSKDYYYFESIEKDSQEFGGTEYININYESCCDEEYSEEDAEVGTGESSFFGEGKRSVILELLIFMCCAAGVFGLCVICCIVFGQLFDSTSSNAIRSPGGISSPFSLQINGGETDETFTFISFHHHPWSAGVVGEETEFFRYENDKPPSYDDLDLTKQPLGELCSSPAPPPYTPSFGLVFNNGNAVPSKTNESQPGT